MAEPQKWVPPYIAFSTLTGLLDRMRDDEGAPPLIDRSYLKGFSGGYQSQVIAAMKSLGLINKDGSVTQRLTDLVAAKDRQEREPMIATLLQELYLDPVRLGGIKATQGQLEAAFREWGITGDTLRKAIAFYLAAAKYSNVKVSSNFRVPAVAPSEGRRSTRKPKAERDADAEGGGNGPEPEKPRPDVSWQQQIEPVVLEWLKRIPAKDEPWPKADRGRWNSVLIAMLDGIYVEDDAGG